MAKSYSPEDLVFRAFTLTMASIATFIGIVLIFVL
jgi:hypothetical protein